MKISKGQSQPEIVADIRLSNSLSVVLCRLFLCQVLIATQLLAGKLSSGSNFGGGLSSLSGFSGGNPNFNQHKLTTVSRKI